MNTLNECPICMDAIDVTKNCVTTECGHCFHASCLMSNVAHNGFGCPYCRTSMADEPESDGEDDDESQSWYSDDEEDRELYDEYALRGMRFMMNNLNGQAHDILDVHDENEYENELRAVVEGNYSNVPNASYISQKLIAQGVTMEDLVMVLMNDHAEYDQPNLNELLNDKDSEIFGKMRIIISNYSPEERENENIDESAPIVPRPIEPVSAPISPPIAESKVANMNVPHRQFISHV
jgi:hypothetical protein